MSDTLSGKHLGGPPTLEAPTALESADPPRSLTAEPSTDSGLGNAVRPAGSPEERRETVTCPGCQKSREVAVNRRVAADFCPEPGCDYPLFWTPTVIQIGPGDAEGDSLRRRPGTDGRLTVASRACPHCDEANPLDAQFCLRCAESMILVARAPVVVPVVAAPPAPEPVPVPGTPLWVWIVVGLITALAVGLIIWAAV